MSGFVKWAYRTSAATLGHLGLKSAVRTHVLPKLVSAIAADQGAQDGPEGPAVAVARQHLERLAQSDKPILVGPWISEIGFELLYWIPFVRWAARTHGLAPERLIAVTRGGAGAWYQPDCARCAELLELLSPEAFRDGNLARWSEAKGQKQGFTTAFEGTCLERAAAKLGLASGDYEVLPPNLMHNIFWFVWNGKAPLELLDRHGLYEPLPRPDTATDLGLPDRYAAVRFYARESLPDVKANRAFINALLDRLGQQIDMVLLDPDLELDDHRDFAIAPRDRLHTLPRRPDPTENLAVQSQVIAHADLFVGTYGGLAYLAPLLGVPAVSFFSDPGGLKPVHGELAGRLFTRLDVPFTVVRTGDWERLRGVGI